MRGGQQTPRKDRRKSSKLRARRNRNDRDMGNESGPVSPLCLLVVLSNMSMASSTWGETEDSILTWSSLCHAAYCLTSALLKFCREAQQQMDGEEGEEGREKEGGRGLETSDRLQRGDREDRKNYEEILYTANTAREWHRELEVCVYC